MKLISLGALVFGMASFVAYSNGAGENSGNSEVSNKSLVEDRNLLKDISFDGLVILKDFSVPITRQEGVKEILSRNVAELFGAFSRDIKGVVSISYRIVHNGDRLSFANFNVVEGDSDAKQKDASVHDEDCPDGLTYVKTCYSEDCVKEALRELGKDFSRGESIYLHHNGIGGVVICSDVQ